MHKEGWRSFGLDCGLPVKDPKSKTFSIRDENLNVPYMDLRGEAAPREVIVLLVVSTAFSA